MPVPRTPPVSELRAAVSVPDIGAMSIGRALAEADRISPAPGTLGSILSTTAVTSGANSGAMVEVAVLVPVVGPPPPKVKPSSRTSRDVLLLHVDMPQELHFELRTTLSLVSDH